MVEIFSNEQFDTTGSAFSARTNTDTFSNIFVKKSVKNLRNLFYRQPQKLLFPFKRHWEKLFLPYFFAIKSSHKKFYTAFGTALIIFFLRYRGRHAIATQKFMIIQHVNRE
jgi:hypothetical protein